MSSGRNVVVADWEEKTRLTPGNKIANPRRDRAYVTVVAGPNIGEMFRLTREETVIGRSAQCDVRVLGEGISRRHTRIVREGEELIVEDMGSTNGTWANAQKITRHPLTDGDKLQLGETTILKFAFHDQLDETFQKHMYESALRDGMTRIYNKKYFVDRLDAEFAFAQRHRVPLTLILFDIDHFKRFNDDFGHQLGDQVLLKLATAMGQAMRVEDVFARYGGEEFVVICRDVALPSAQIFAERLRKTAAALTVEHEGQQLHCTISLGVAGLPDSAVNSPPELIELADRSLMQAKRDGRNRAVVYFPAAR